MFDFLFDIYDLVAANEIDRATDLLFRSVDVMARSEDFDNLNTLLALVDVDRLDANLMIDFLSITKNLPALSNRNFLFGQIKTKLDTICPAISDGLLFGLDKQKG